MRLEEVIIKPIITEKATAANQKNQYIFLVHPDSNKIEIAKAAEKFLKVKVVKVNVVNLKAKARRFRGIEGSTSAVKKAYITLAPGQTIDLFTGV
jgi:large subunit ribosomal protein L23